MLQIMPPKRALQEDQKKLTLTLRFKLRLAPIEAEGIQTVGLGHVYAKRRCLKRVLQFWHPLGPDRFEAPVYFYLRDCGIDDVSGT